MPPTAVAIKRIARDTANVCGAAALASQGIYYIPCDEDMTRGTALLIGQSNTPYYGGYYFFSIKFPDDYPFSPLRVETLTQDGITRFNPNMYKEGKVCLSILNTWHDGPQWSGVQTLESVLLIIMADVLHANPIINEPAYRGHSITSPTAVIYNRMIWHANIRTAILQMLKKPPVWALPFMNIMTTHFTAHKSNLLECAAKYIQYDGIHDICPVYNMQTDYTFGDLLEKLTTTKI
jgi:ubiquitin-protein ligase